MSNLGKAIYMACFALLFIFAASTSIYLYNTLSVYLKSTTGLAGVEKRTEAAVADTSIKAREATRSEILITLYNMEQMHVKAMLVCFPDGEEVFADISNSIPQNMITKLNSISDSVTFTYKYVASTVIYIANEDV